MKNIKFLSFILALVFVFSVFPFNTVYAVENTENAANTQETQEFTLPDIVDTTEARERGYVGRVKDEEKDNYTFVFQNSDNTRTMRVYSHPVKYTDKDGNIKDITLDIQSRTGGGFETKDNSIKTTFGKKLSDGIRLQHEEVDVKLIPANLQSLATLSADSKTVSYVLDEKTTLEYSLTYTGFKEDIVVSEYTGQTEYTFLLYTNGLTVKEEMGSHYLADSEGNRKANIGDIIIFTADERNNTLGELTYTEVKPNQIYLLTIHIDAEYLADEDTVYPIRIDPTFEVTDSASAPIEDVTVYTGTSYYSGTSGILYIGRSNNKVYRALMRLPNLTVPVVFPEMVLSASVELRDVMCQSTQVPIICTPYPAIAAGWSENTTTTWNSTQSYYKSSQVLDEQVVYYGNGNVSGDSQRYAFDITEEVKNWVTGPSTPERGIVFRMSDSFEAQTPSTTQDELKYFGSYNRSDYKPSFSLRYRTEAIFTFSYTNSSTYYLSSTHSDSGTVKGVISSNPEYNGNTMWGIKYLPGYDAYQIISMGTKANNGLSKNCIYSYTSSVGIQDEYFATMKTIFDVTRTENGKYIFQGRDTGKYLCIDSSNVLTQTEYVNSATVFTANCIETESFNNFWSGSYTSGIYDGVVHIQIAVDDSITQCALYENNDFSSALSWNGISDNVIIYGPDEEPPAGITPFVVTFRVATIPLSYVLVNGITYTFFTFAMTVPNGLTVEQVQNLSTSDLTQLTESNWTSVTIYLNDDQENYLEMSGTEAAMQATINKVIAHEMGHALKLAHLNDSTNHDFSGDRNHYDSHEAVYALMNQGAPVGNSENILAAAIPQAHDRISLISKWEYHSNCSH